MTALELVGDRLNDSTSVNELSGLTMKNGRVDHTDQGHDDLLIAWLLACYFILFGSNHHLYGIAPDEFMCNVQKGGELIDADRKKEIIQMQHQMVELKNRLHRPNLNPVVKAAYERELNKLMGAVGDVEILDDALKPLDQVTSDANQAAKQRMGSDVSAYMAYL